MKHCFKLLLLLLLSCHSRQEKIISTNSPIDTVQPTEVSRAELWSFTTQPEEYFVDSVNIGRKSLNKVELAKYRTSDSVYVVIKFYSKQHGWWNLKNTFQFRKDGVTSCDPEFSDFNNDCFNDMTYKWTIAARSVNDLRRLFIYDPSIDELVYLKNSEHFPNLLYNPDLDCIDAFLVYGGCSTVFLSIRGDSLKEFASVELFDGFTVTEYDYLGNERIILRDTTNEEGYIRYKNYKPLKAYDQY